MTFLIDFCNAASSETCNEDLGMTDGSIQDLQITASSWLSKYPPWNAKPLRNGWCAEKTDFQPWIMVCAFKRIIFRNSTKSFFMHFNDFIIYFLVNSTSGHSERDPKHGHRKDK